MTQREFAAFLGLPINTYTNWVLGLRTPGADAIIRICTQLGVSAGWLLGLETSPTAVGVREIQASYNTRSCSACVQKDKRIEELTITVDRLNRVIDKLTK